LIDAGDGAGLLALIDQEPDAIKSRDDSGLSPLMHAAYRGRGLVYEIVATHGSDNPWDRILLGESDGLPAPDACGPAGFTPLHIAAFAKNVAAAEALMAARADLNAFATASFARVTPLGTCAAVGATEVARALMRRGADPTLAEVEGATPLAEAFRNGHAE